MSPRFGLCGPAYTSQSLNADAQSCINLYLEQDESGAGNAPLVLYPTPGTKTFVDLGRTVTPGVDGIGAFDTEASAIGSFGAPGGSISTGNATPASPPEFAIFGPIPDALGLTFTPGAGFTPFGGLSQQAEANGTLAGTGAYTGAGGTINWAAAIALFKQFGASAPAIVQQLTIVSGGFVAGNHSNTFASPLTAGNTVIVILEATESVGDPAMTVSDGVNTYALVATIRNPSGNSPTYTMYAAQNVAAGSPLITAHTAANCFGASILAYEMQGGNAAVTNTGPIRDEIFINGRAFVICGSDFDEIFANGTFTTWGQVANDSLIATHGATPQQILIASAGTAYVFDLMANTLTPVPGITFPGPVSQAAVCDGFFLLTVQNTKEFFVSAPLDATDWVTNGSAIVSVFADNIVSMLVHDREIHFWSDRERTVYYDSGNIFPFDVIPGTTIQAGSAAKSSPARLDDRVLWLNSDDNGSATVKMGIGYTPQRISTHALEFAMQGYARVDDAVGYTYQDQGHSFYVLYFPTPSKTWVYDATISTMIGVQCWHEREFYLASTGGSQAHKSQCHMFAFGKHLVGDWSSGKVYQLQIPTLNGATWTFADDDGNIIRRVRRAAHISKEQKRLFVNELRVYVETGLGPIPPLPEPAPYPLSVVLEDVNSPGTFWLVTIEDDGTVDAASTSGPSSIIFLNDPFKPGHSYQLYLSTGPTEVVGSEVTFNASYPEVFLMATITSQLSTGFTAKQGL